MNKAESIFRRIFKLDTTHIVSNTDIPAESTTSPTVTDAPLENERIATMAGDVERDLGIKLTDRPQS